MASAKKHFDDHLFLLKDAPGIRLPECGKPIKGSFFNSVKRLNQDIRDLIPPRHYCALSPNPFGDLKTAFSTIERGLGKRHARINAAIDVLDRHDPIKAGVSHVKTILRAIKGDGPLVTVVDPASKLNNDCILMIGTEPASNTYTYRRADNYEVDVSMLRQGLASLQAVEESLATSDIRRKAVCAMRQLVDTHLWCVMKHLSVDHEGMIFCLSFNVDNRKFYSHSHRPVGSDIALPE